MANKPRIKELKDALRDCIDYLEAAWETIAEAKAQSDSELITEYRLVLTKPDPPESEKSERPLDKPGPHPQNPGMT